MPGLTPAVQWRCLPFDALRARTLYALLRLRSAVFVVEQQCVFQDMDDIDPHCLHLLGESGGALLACTRLVPAGLSFAEVSFGRVAIDPAARGSGLGHTLVRESVRQIEALWGPQPIRIGAQAHLAHFYRRHGFEPDGEPYVEDGIAHIEMLRPSNPAFIQETTP